MKLNELNFDLLSDKELIMICLKYKIIKKEDIPKTTRKELLVIIKLFLKKKLDVYGQKKEENVKSVQIQRRMSTSGKLQQTNKRSIPRPIVKRRMSQPITKIEKIGAKETIQKNEIKHVAQEEVKREIKSIDPKYDLIGMYPPVKKLIAIGDVHGDLRVTLIALKLSEVIPQHSTEKDLHSIHWCGGSTWIIQLGDQIDRCRPDELDKNCIKDFSYVYQDEGNKMKIIKLYN